ncbi:hypothetical protein HA402_014046 [Bradysia odoriphaga]|nr:hypothetical protein HA402_014046 [Bradysia odoriphaga]
MSKECLIFGLVILLSLHLIVASDSLTFERNIFFEFYNGSNEISYVSNSFGDDLVGGSGCNSSGDVAIIVHGWLESCETLWIQEMISLLNEHRGGCIICMNYSAYSKNFNYFGLVADFSFIDDILVNKLHQLVQEEFAPDKIFIFGFSFGGQLALEAGRRFGKQLISRIDACEPAGPGFDSNQTYSKQSPMDSAKFVQCIHTSYDKGTQKRSCHQNWHLGQCGLYQIAAGPYPLGSHGLCPYFYNSAFSNQFHAIPQPATCPTSKRLPMHPLVGISMGYVFNDLSEVNDTTGYDYYANTYKMPPYHTDVEKEMEAKS